MLHRQADDAVERRAVFAAALEQAEQLLTAAQSVGHASRPLLLFYGLSQAGRAIAAARLADNWKPKSHGITGDKDKPVPLAERECWATNSGSFVLMARTVGQSAKALGTFPVAAAWAAIPDVSGWLFTDKYRQPLTLSEMPAQGGMRFGRTPPVIVAGGLPETLLTLTDEHRREWVNIGLSSYPSAQGLRLLGSDDLATPVRIWRNETYTASVYLEAMPGTQDKPDAVIRRHGGQYGDSFYLFPALGEASIPMHPLLSWWAVLWTLSMMARYEPADWLTTLKIDEPGVASSVEVLLDVALAAVPQLVLEVLAGWVMVPELSTQEGTL
jgi:hypothetical protein